MFEKLPNGSYTDFTEKYFNNYENNHHALIKLIDNESSIYNSVSVFFKRFGYLILSLVGQSDLPALITNNKIVKVLTNEIRFIDKIKTEARVNELGISILGKKSVADIEKDVIKTSNEIIKGLKNKKSNEYLEFQKEVEKHNTLLSRPSVSYRADEQHAAVNSSQQELDKRRIEDPTGSLQEPEEDEMSAGLAKAIGDLEEAEEDFLKFQKEEQEEIEKYEQDLLKSLKEDEEEFEKSDDFCHTQNNMSSSNSETAISVDNDFSADVQNVENVPEKEELQQQSEESIVRNRDTKDPKDSKKRQGTS